MMSLKSLFLILFLSLNNYGQVYSNTCQLDGFTGWWKPIELPDTPSDFRGVIKVFKTADILRARVEKSEFLDTEYNFQENTLKILTKHDADTKLPSELTIKVSLDCYPEGVTKVDMVSKVTENSGNTLPLFSQDKYDYTMGMMIPEHFDLTSLVPISVSDYSSQPGITYEIEDNEYLKVGLKSTTSNGIEYTTTLTVLENITAPFSHNFTLTATNTGDTSKSTNVEISVNVVSLNEEEDDEGEIIHLPEFSKHLYYADYTSSHKFTIEEGPIMVDCGIQSNTVLKQTGYEEFFKIRFNGKSLRNLIVEQIAPLKEEILNTREFIIIEIEAENEGLNIPGHAALLIRLPKFYEDNSEPNEPPKEGSNEIPEESKEIPEENTESEATVPPTNENSTPENDVTTEESKKCKRRVVEGYFTDANTIPIVLFIFAVTAIVFTNVYVIILFVREQPAFGISKGF